MGVSDDDGSVADERDMLIALQGRLITQERLTDALLLDYVARSRKTTYSDAAERFSDVIIANSQQIIIPTNSYADEVWEEAGKVLRARLDLLQSRADSLDSSTTDDQ